MNIRSEQLESATREEITSPKPPFPEQTQEFPGSDEAMRPVADHGEKNYSGSGRLQDSVALITGGDSGIGRAVALAFAREGADVLISYLNEDDDAEESARWVRDAGRRVATVRGDIQDPHHCEQLVAKTMEEFGRIDVLVNNAAIQMPVETPEELSIEQFEKTFRVNLFAMFYLCKAALPRMRSGSCIINTASIQGYDPSSYLLDYASTKSAIIGFTKALAKSVIDRGIRVNAVAPGPVWTPLIPATFPAERVAKFGQSNPFERPAQPAELAPIYVLLASPESSYIAGEVYGATGCRSPF